MLYTSVLGFVRHVFHIRTVFTLNYYQKHVQSWDQQLSVRPEGLSHVTHISRCLLGGNLIFYKLFPALAEVEGVGRLHFKSIILDGEGEHV